MLLAAGCDEPTRRAGSHGVAARVETAAAHKLLASDAAAGAQFGAAASAAGDLNGDGYADVVVGAVHDSDSGAEAGAAYVYYGAASGLTSVEHKLLADDGAAGDQYGAAVSTAGDVDGDGYTDLLVAAPDHDSSAGAAYLYFGSATGIQTASAVKIAASDGGDSHRFGSAVSAAGDLNNDGYGDIIVGASEAPQGELAQAGAAYVYYGSATGLQDREDRLVPDDSDEDHRYGAAVSAAGDVDGDGYDDVIVGATEHGGAGGAYIHYGSASGVGDAELLKASNQQDGAQMGRHVSGAGDVNRDGYDDVIVGAQACAPDGDGVEKGAAYIYYGGSGGVIAEDVLLASDGDGGDLFGHGVSGAGDLDADGYDDVIVGAYGVDDSGEGAGAAYVYYGSMSGVDRSTEEKLLAADGGAGHHFGQSAAGAGDINGDGHDDLLVAARDDDDAGDGAGSVHVYFGYADIDGDGIYAAEDCDDRDVAVGGPTPHHVDADEDGYGADTTADACPGAPGYADNDADCDDTDAAIRPDASDTCGDGVDSDCDGIGGPLGDEDGDGLRFTTEAKLGSSDCATDSDGDGLDDDQEVVHGTDITDPDSDGDGLSDGYEVNISGTDPNDYDTDDDGLTDAEELSGSGSGSGSGSDSGDDEEPLAAEEDADTGTSTAALSGEAPKGCAARSGAPLGWATLLGLVIVGPLRRRDGHSR